MCFQSFGQNRFPSVDSAKNYALRYVRNSTVESFTNLRMQQVVVGTLELLDSLTAISGGGGIDSIWLSSSATKDTIKYSISGYTYTAATLDKASLRIAISDSAAMLAGYTRLTRFADSLSAHTTRFNVLYDSLNKHVTRDDTTRNGIRSDLNGKQGALTLTTTGSSGASTLVGNTLNIPQYSGGGGGLADDSTNTFGTQIQMYAGVLKVNRSAGANTWSVLEDADHTQLGITSVTSDATKVTVNYRPGSKVITMLGAQDETMSFAAQTNDGTPFYTYGPYFLGARVFVDYAEFYIKKIVNASFLVTYNGSAWSVIGDAYNPSSPSWTITWSAGRLRIKDMAAGMRKNPSANMYSPNGVVTNMKYIPTIEVISSTWVDIYFYDASTGAKYTDATPPTDFGVYLDFGVFGNQVNPNTEDFGNTGVTNFWIFGLMKK